MFLSPLLYVPNLYIPKKYISGKRDYEVIERGEEREEKTNLSALTSRFLLFCESWIEQQTKRTHIPKLLIDTILQAYKTYVMPSHSVDSSILLSFFSIFPSVSFFLLSFYFSFPLFSFFIPTQFSDCVSRTRILFPSFLSMWITMGPRLETDGSISSRIPPFIPSPPSPTPSATSTIHPFSFLSLFHSISFFLPQHFQPEESDCDSRSNWMKFSVRREGHSSK